METDAPTDRRPTKEPSAATEAVDGGTDPRIVATRGAVLTAALELVAEVGFAAATIEKVSERSGVARSTIYRRWPDPTRLFLEAFWPMTEAEGAPPRSGDTRADLAAYLRNLVERLSDPVYFPAFVALVDRAARDPEFAAMHRALTDARRSRAAVVIDAGIEAGVLRPAIDVEEAVEALVAPFLYIRMIRHGDIGDHDVDRVLADFMLRYAVGPDERA